MFKHPEDTLLQHAHVWHGVAIGWHNDINSSIHTLESNHERIAGVKFTLKHKSILFVSFYAPTSGQDDDYLESVSYLSQYILQHATSEAELVIGTDSNCSSKSTSRRKLSWKSFCEKFSLKIFKTGSPTFHHNNGTSESSIDFFAASSSLLISNPTQHCTLENPLNLSSHDPILATLSVKHVAEQEVSKFSHTYTKFERQKIIWDKSKMNEYQQLAAEALSGASLLWDSPETIPALTSIFSNLLVKCATLVFESKSSSIQSQSNHSSKKIVQAEISLTVNFNSWKKAGKPQMKTDSIKAAYTFARSNLQRLRRYEENLEVINHNNYLMNAHSNNRNNVYSRMKRFRGDSTTTPTPTLQTPVGTFHGDDVLEGFAPDAEYLGRSNKTSCKYDQSFYKICKLDNLYIFEFTGDDQVSIPAMTLSQLDHILHAKMKPGKSCDIYQLTVEHLRHCGQQAKAHILDLVNRILDNIYFLTCPQIKIGLGSALHKGKNKPLTKSNSYRRITVTPIIGAIIYYIDPVAESIFRAVQSPDQLGFTAGISYLLASIQRGECQRWAVDHKLTCFGVSLDGEAAFPSVEREIQVRELYSVGERGDLLSYSKNTYKNTECHLKLNGKVSRKIQEQKGNRQGHVRASGHFIAYINPLLLALNSSSLGFQIGPFSITAMCVADDTYVLTKTPSSLQSALNIVNHYGNRYQLTFNAEKTKM